MTDTHAVIGELTAFALTVPAGYVPGAHLELEPRGDTVPDHESEGFLALPMDVQVNKARCNDEPGCVDHARSREHILANRLDVAIADAHVAHGVQAGFRVHHPAALQNQVIHTDAGLARRAGGEGEGEGGAAATSDLLDD